MGSLIPKAKKLMKCPICKHGETVPGKVSVTLSRPEGVTIVFKDVPADVCDNCGEEYVSESVTASMMEQARAAAEAGVQVDVRSFAA